MTDRRANGRTTGVDRTQTEKRSSGQWTESTRSITSPADTSGRMALVLAAFALSVALFLIILVAVAASNA